MDELGPFFALDTWQPDAGWLPLRDLVDGGLTQRVEVGRALLAERAGVMRTDIEPRVAASVVFLGLAARLMSPALGSAVLADVVPELSLDSLWWQPVSSGPWPMATDAVPRTQDGSFVEIILEGVVAPVLDAFADEFRLSRLVLWGNVASALGGAVGMLAAARPDRSGAALDLAKQLLRVPPLRGTGEFAPRFQRRTCCLFYRVPGAGLCGDCVLAGKADP